MVFRTRDIAVIAVCAALWGVLNATLSPVFFNLFHLPFLCDLIGFASLIIAVWIVRKPGAATAVGFIATALDFIFRPGALHFFGFTVASVLFDFLTWLPSYPNLFEKRLMGIILLTLMSLISAAIAGAIIGFLFMPLPALAAWGGVAGWAGLHAIGGIMGGLLGSSLTAALETRGISVLKA